MNLDYVKTLHLPYPSQHLHNTLCAKFIGPNEIMGYIALWGSPELADLSTDFFTVKTDFWDERLGLPRPLTYDHALDPATKNDPLIGAIEAFGDDEIGKWYAAQLKRNMTYRKALDRLIDEGRLGTSSDSVPQYVQRVRTKSGANWLRTWPLIGGALTPTPAEPRMVGLDAPVCKSIGFDSVVAAYPTPAARTGRRTVRAWQYPDGSPKRSPTHAELDRLHAELRAWADRHPDLIDPQQGPLSF